MMKWFVLSFCLFIVLNPAIAQQNYEVSRIPKDLLSYASAVIRNSEESIEVKDLDNTVHHVKKAITVLNKNGDHLAIMVLFYDKSTVIKYVKGTIYNEFGRQTGKFSERDFEDGNAWDGFSLFIGTKVKHYIPTVTEYPYTIEYEYELKYKQTLNIPDWEPNGNFGMAIEKSVYTFSCNPDFNIRYKEINMPGKASISNAAGGPKVYTWQVSNLKAIKDEPFSPNPETWFSRVKIAPERFSYYNISGTFSSWKELGKWNYDKLLRGRTALSAETEAYMKELTKDITDPKLKAKKIYEYMQGKTRYVSVQVGIGGYQPFMASDVDKLSYGDCKALVNYTQALLKAVNIESYYCVVEASHERKVSFLSDFASMDQGNHIILCLPFKNDTTWADCTSKTIPFGYLGTFTDDREVLAVTPEGGKLMHTPKYTAQNNLRTRQASFTINEAGELQGSMTTTFKGTEYEDRDEEIEEAPEEQFKSIRNIYPINNMVIEKLEFKQDKSLQPATTESIKLKARDYGSVSDGKFYFMLNVAGRMMRSPRDVRNRVTDVCIQHGYTYRDEIKYSIPAGYHLDKIPLNVAIDRPFGSYKATMLMNGNELIYKREFQLIDGTYSKDTYHSLVDFYRDVVDADNYTVSLVKTP
ncbi:hypothetical protein BH09BAC6_BH09BAC6_19720 [soil metagenome]